MPDESLVFSYSAAEPELKRYTAPPPATLLRAAGFPGAAALLGVVCSAAALILAACGEPSVPGGEITIANHILDKEYNSFTVDQIVLDRGATSYRALLKPGDEVTLPLRGVRSLRFTRDYENHSMMYVVECPAGFNKRITIKLLDIHTNRLGGGCQLVKRGKREKGEWVKWE